MKVNVHRTLLLVIVFILFSFTACTTRGARDSDEAVSSQRPVPRDQTSESVIMESSHEESEPSESSPASVSQEQENSEESNTAEADNQAQDSNTSPITELFFISISNENGVDITLDIPKRWSRDAVNIFDENERQIGSLWAIPDTPQTYIPQDIDNPFAEADNIVSSIQNSPGFETRDYTVNGLPIRAYYYGSGEDGPDFLTDYQYTYFILIDNEVLRITFHTRIDGAVYSIDDFDKIIDSFAVAS